MNEIRLIIILELLTFFTRVINLLKIPIFTDEAIYIRWAQIGLADPAHRFISLTDGKQPLLIWLMYPMLKIFTDPLMAGRIVSVLSGCLAVLGVYVVGRELFNKKVALFSALAFIFSPFTLIYDKLALYDSLLTCITIWCIYLEIKLVKETNLEKSLLLGLLIGIGLLTKSSAFFFIYLLPFSLLLFTYKRKEAKKKLINWILYSGFSVLISQVIYNMLRLSPWFYIVRQKNYTFIYTFSEFLNKPFEVFIPNLHGLIFFVYDYLTLPIIIYIFGAIILSIILKEKRILFLLCWFTFPFFALAIFGRVLFPRFTLFMIVPHFILFGYSTDKILSFSRKKNKLILIIFLPLIYTVYQSLLVVIKPVEAAIPVNDRNQLFDDWPSGYGVKEVINYLENQAKAGHIVVGTEGTFGLFPAALEIYLKKNPNIEIYGFWPVSEVPEVLIKSSLSYPTYLIFKEKQEIPPGWPLKLIAKYPRGKGKTALLFYKVDTSSR